jgi:hypothetical protein
MVASRKVKALARDEKPQRRWLFRVLGVCVLAAAGFLGAPYWRASAGRPFSETPWWASALATYALFFALFLMAIGGSAGWALDGGEDPRKERAFTLALIRTLLVGPLVLVLFGHVLWVPFDIAPGQWPWGVDLAARVAVSAPGVWFAYSIVMGLIRRTRRSAAQPALVWSTGLMFLLSLALLTSWPWIGSWLPVGVRIVMLFVIVTVAALLAKRIDSGAPIRS